MRIVSAEVIRIVSAELMRIVSAEVMRIVSAEVMRIVSAEVMRMGGVVGREYPHQINRLLFQLFSLLFFLNLFYFNKKYSTG